MLFSDLVPTGKEPNQSSGKSKIRPVSNQAQQEAKPADYEAPKPVENVESSAGMRGPSKSAAPVLSDLVLAELEANRIVLVQEVVRQLVTTTRIAVSEVDSFTLKIQKQFKEKSLVLACIADEIGMDCDEVQSLCVKTARVDGRIFAAAQENFRRINPDQYRFLTERGFLPIYRSAYALSVLVESQDLKPTENLLDELGWNREMAVFPVEATVSSLSDLLNFHG